MEEKPNAGTVSLWELFSTMFRVGLFTFGGGYAMIAQIRETVVDSKHWIDEDELMQVIMIAESTPGPIAINLATYLGYKKHGIAGSAAATLGVVLPSLIIIYVISLFLDRFMANAVVKNAFVGIRCAVALLIFRAGWGMLRKVEKKPLPLITFGIVTALMLAGELFSFTVSTILLIAAGGLLGALAYRKKGAGK